MSRILKRIASHFGALVVLSFCSFSYSNAQTVQTTPNLITSGQNHTWSGVTTGTLPGNYMPGGPSPIYDPSTDTITYSYNNAYVGQVKWINQALSGTGIQINGYNWSYDVRNMNGDDRQGNVDSFSISTVLRGLNNSYLLSNTQNFNTKFDWTSYSGTKTAATPYNLADVTYLQIGIQGADSGFWAGYFGPQIRNVNMSLNYTVDPCVGNPRYSPSCPGFNTDMWSTGDVTSVYGTNFAIQQALGFGNTGVRVHSTTWGYDYSIGGRRCVWDLLGLCMEWANSSVGGSMSVLNNTGTQIAYDTASHSGENVSGSFRREVILGSTSPDISTLGNASISTWTSGIAAVTPYMGFNFTPDICSSNPLVNPQCPGYGQAYFTQQCSMNALHDPSCPGYAAAYFTQQCTINQLSNPACPGYATAYLNYQCSVNALYAPQCPGYEAAYLQQQCSANPLYSVNCSGYQTATAQCSTNPLSAGYCPEYNTALTQCTANGLAYSYCPTYQSELTYCSTDPLFNNLCPTYQTATAQCSANPLTASYCPNYQSASTQCSTNPLSASYCPNYQTATTQCSTNPLYASYCPGYQTATSSCSANSLNHSYCPGYTSALTTCSTNPLSNSLCSGYTAASSACSNNQLTYSYCPSYTTTLAACGSNPQSNTMCPGYSTTASSSGSGSNSTPIVVAQASSDPAAQAAPIVADPVVNSVVTTKSTATNSEASPAAAVKLTQPAPATTTASPVAAAAAAQEKKEEKKAEEKKAEEKKTESSTTSTASSSGSSSGGDKDKPKTARQEIQERREAAAKAKAIEDGKNLAGKVGEAATMEAQVAVQNVVIQAMGFTPGFDAYGRAMLPDAAGYRPFEIYKGQRNIDNPSGRRFMTGSDRLHTEMVDQQYNLTK